MAYKYLIGRTLLDWAEYRFVFRALEQGYTGTQIRSAMHTLFGRGIPDPTLTIARSFYADGILRAERAYRRFQGRGVTDLLNTPLALSPFEANQRYLVEGYFHARVDGQRKRIGFSFNNEGFNQEDLERRVSEMWDLTAKDSFEDAILENITFHNIMLNPERV